MKIIDGASKKEILYYLPNVETAENLSRFFFFFSDGTRLRVISAIAI